MALERSAPAQRTIAPTQIIAGAFCIVERGQIVRAAAPTGIEFWAAGRGSWLRFVDRFRPWPVHYAGTGPQLRLVDPL